MVHLPLWTSTWKRSRVSSALKLTKVCIPVLSFLAGYLFHSLIYAASDQSLLDAASSHLDSSGTANHVLLVALIFSSVANFGKRQAIRETWLSDVTADVRYFFVISSGTAKEDERVLLSVEQSKHGDLVVFHNLEDSFYLLTGKLMAAFGWLTGSAVLGTVGTSDTPKPFDNYTFVLKCDDDSFVRVTEIVNELKTTYSGQRGDRLYWGFFDGRGKAKKSGKYKEDEWVICDHYLPYALGGGYILARPLVEFIVRNADHLKQYKNEDVSVGAWLSSYSGLTRVHDPRFDTEYLSRGCHQTYLITHKHSDAAMRTFHENLRSTGRLCQREFKTRMSYVYNWQVPPSNCCARVNHNIP